MTPSEQSRPAFLDLPESRRLEFKERFPKGEQVARTAVAFANGAGGRIVFGVKDSPREVVGIPDDQLFALEEKVVNAIFDHCVPDIVPEVYIQTVDGKSLLVAEIYPGSQKPYGIKRAGRSPEIYIRAGASNRKAATDTIEALERQRRRISFDALTVYGCPVEEVDLSGFIRDFKARTGRQLGRSQLFNLGLFQKETDGTFPTNAALLLSDANARRRFFGHAKIECARFKGAVRRDFLDQATIDLPVHAAVEPAMAFIKKNIALGATIGEIYREDRWEYPLGAIREALVNAIIHRDYAASGADIKVAIYDDMLEITSPGPLPDTLPVEELGTGRSEIRNRVLAPIFKELKLIEAWGSGIQKMRQELADYPAIDLVLREAGHLFQVQFIKKEAVQQAGLDDGGDQVGTKSGPSRDQVGTKLAPSKDPAGTKQAPSRHQVGTKFDLVPKQLNALKLCDKPKSSAELMAQAERTDRTKFKKSVIDPLLSAGLLEMTDPDSPNSPKQKYRITDKGKDFINKQA